MSTQVKRTVVVYMYGGGNPMWYQHCWPFSHGRNADIEPGRGRQSCKEGSPTRTNQYFCSSSPEHRTRFHEEEEENQKKRHASGAVNQILEPVVVYGGTVCGSCIFEFSPMTKSN
ncbi:hypothetical protein TYRP_013751 [Tyrophagus putrescentiae]|nr:hypothetical protein TYRP_013751 [Tyrophagus putrescentiae]